MSTDVLPPAAQGLREWVTGQRVGEARVLSAQASIQQDSSGEQAVFFDVLLSGPEPDEETWPVDEVLGFHDRVDREAQDRGLTLPWHVQLIPEREEHFAVEDEGE